MDKKIVMSNADINDAAESIAAIIQAVGNSGQRYNPKFGYMLGRNLRILRGENAEYSEAKQDLIQKYGEAKQTEDGRNYWQINTEDRDQVKAYRDELKEISEIEHEVTLFCVDAETLKGWEIPFDYEVALWFLLEDEL
ncbi:MAG: hypothetical protein PHC62_00545 [Candidatus Izemoplasmatales bacterium]|nr:hypothetical protein [Candidatus Izemoplasmatales bacterium]